jgi:hypothetical protein
MIVAFIGNHARSSSLTRVRMGLNRISSLVILALIFFTPSFYSKAKEDFGDTSALGFNFGISKKQAMQVIKEKGKKVIENSVDSKNIRTILIQGTVGEIPLHIPESQALTQLEFYDDELMTSTLIVESADYSSRDEMANELYKYLRDSYGEIANNEKVLNYITWTWRQPKVKVVLTADQNSDIFKIAYTYEPLSQTKREKELDQKRKDKPEDPATEMFLEGDYSKPAHLKE